MQYVPFVANIDKINNVVDISKLYNTLPSKILNIKDEYTAFCLNQACTFIRSMNDNGVKPIHTIKRNKCTSFSDLYAKYK